MAPPKDIARSYPKRGLTADVGFRSEPAFVGDGSAYFDNDYATATLSTTPGSSFSYGLWMNVSDFVPSSESVLIEIGVSGSAGGQVTITLTSTGQVKIFNGSTFIGTTAANTVSLNTWHFIAVAVDGSSGGLKIYVDGLDVTGTHTATFNVTNKGMTVGAYSSSSSYYTEGNLANVFYCTEILTQDQVRQIMRFSSAAQFATITGMESFYPLSADFNDAIGSANLTNSGATLQVKKPQLPRGLDLARGAAMARVYTGRCVDFDGSADYLLADSSLSSAADLSYSAWVNLDSNSGTRTIVGENSEITIYLYGNKIGAWNLWGTLGAGEYAEKQSTNNAPTGRWVHIGVSYIYSSNTLKLYIDGVDQPTVPSPVIGPGSTSGKLEIGARDNGGSPLQFLDGKVAGVKRFNVALTQAQIRELYHNPEQVLPTGVSASNLRRYYPLSDYNDATAGGMGGRYFQDMGADGEPAEDQGSSSMAFAQPVPCPQLGLQQSATRVYFERNATRAQATLGAAPGTTCTMSAWVMVDEQFSFQYFMKNGTNITANAFFAFAIDTNRRLYAVQSSNIQAEGSLALSDYGEWNHVVAMTKSTAPYVRFFINGVEDTSITDNGMVAFNLTSTAIDIGSDGGSSNHLKGFLNDCAIWDVELSDPEVAALYNSGVQGMDVSTVQSSNLKGWWKCDDLTSFKDYSGNGANATLTASVNAASFPENASGSTIVGDFSMKRKGVSVLNPTATPFGGTLGGAAGAGLGAQIANDGSLSPDPSKGGYSFSAFIRLEQASGASPWYPHVFSGTNYNTASQRYVLNFGNLSVAAVPPGITISDGSTPRDYDWPSVLSNPEEWHQLAFTIDYTTSPNTTFKLYLDGALVSTQATHVHTGFDPGDILVSSYPYGNGNFPGAIACFKMYQAKLSDNEIEQIYRSDLRLIKGLENE